MLGKSRMVCTILILSMILVFSTSCASSSLKTPDSAVNGGGTDGAGNGTEQASEKKDYGVAKVILGMGFSKGTEVDQVTDYVKELCGVKVKVIFADNPFQTYNLMVAANEDVDFINVSYTNYLKLLATDSLRPIDDLLDKHGQDIKKIINPNHWKWLKNEAGEILAIPSEGVAVTDTIQIRSDWLKNLDLSMPQTLQEFENTLIKFKEAYNTTPLWLGMEDADVSLGGCMLPMGYSWWKDEETGEYLPPEMHPEYINMLTLLTDWYKKGIIHPETFSSEKGMYVEANEIGAHIGGYSATFNNTLNLLKKEPNAEFVYVPELQGAYQNGYVGNVRPGGTAIISLNSKNPEGAMRFLNWTVSSPENITISRLGIPGQHFEWADKTSKPRTVRTLTIDLHDTRWIGGTLQLFSVNGTVEREVITNDNIRLKWYYDFWDLADAGKVKSYTTLDDELLLTDNLLPETIKLKNAVDTAAFETKIRIITGNTPISEWESFIKEWKKIGMETIINEKNTVIKGLGK